MQKIRLGIRSVSQLGQGTWNIANSSTERARELAALRRGIELGMEVIDTAEMYGSGRSEDLVGEAIRGVRDKVYLVSKVLPSNASTKGTVKACEASLSRLGVDSLDLYLLHWRGRYALAETLEGFHQLQAQGKIKAWGVSNFDVADMEELVALDGGEQCVANQVLYNPENRGIEYDLVPWCQRREVTLMAYSPVGQGGGLLQNDVLNRIARDHGVFPAQVVLAWCMRNGALAIPKAGSVQHVEENVRSSDVRLSDADFAAIDQAFPAPKRKLPLSTL